MEDSQTNNQLTILDLLRVDLCARPILDNVPVRELLCLELVSRQCQDLVHKYMASCRTLSFQYVRSRQTDCEVTAEASHRRIDVPLEDCSLPRAISTVKKWGQYLTKVTTSCCDEALFEVIASNYPNLRYIEFYNLRGEYFPINQIKNCKNLKKITFKHTSTRKSSEYNLSVTSRIVGWDEIEFDDIDLQSFCEEDFIESIQSTRSLNSLTFATHNSRDSASVRLKGATMTLLGISAEWRFFMSEAKNASIYRSLFRNQLQRILQPLLCLDSD